MSDHENQEEVISSPLSSPSSSIFELDDFDSVPLQRAPGPALTDNLPPFNPSSQPTGDEDDAESPKSRTGSSTSLTRQNTVHHTDPSNDLTADSITARVNTTGGPAQDGSGNARLATPPVEKRLATPESPDPIAVAPVDTLLNGRKRKAPEPSSEPSSSRTKKKIIVKKARNNNAARKWEAPAVFTDAKSPLVKAPLRAILLHPQAWDVLSPADQAELRAMLSVDRPASLSKSPSPPGSGPHIDMSPPAPERPNLDYLRSDDSFRFDCARYTENIGEGCHDPDWLAESWSAHERRKRGDFQEYLASKLERDWDVVIPEKEEGKNESKEEEEAHGHSESVEAVPEGADASDKNVDAALGESPGTSGANDRTGGTALDESPTSSSVGESKFTDMKLDVAPDDQKQEAEDGDGDTRGSVTTG